MPQMFRYCGQRFQVYKRAHKTCDTVSGQYVGLRLSHAVHLDLRCDGQAYGGCQAACLIFWKEAWLKRVGEEDTKLPSIANLLAKPGEAGCTEPDVWRATKHGLPGRADLFLPGHRAPSLHDPAEMVGRKAICRGLPFRQRVARRAAARVRLSLLLLCHAVELARPRTAWALAVRPLPADLGWRPLPAARRADPCRQADAAMRSRAQAR